MNILIVEDEALAAERLEGMIKQIWPQCNIAARTASIRDTVKWLTNNKADLVFLDIQLSDGISFSIFEQIQLTTPVIFTTAYDEYAIKAFQLNSIAYLLKPVKKAELENSLNKYLKIKSLFSPDIEGLLATLQGAGPGYKKRFVIQVGDKIRKVDIGEVAYFYALERYVFVRTTDNHSYPLEYTLDTLMSMLDPEKFFRINRKYIVSIEAIRQMTAWSRSRVKLLLHPNPDDDMETIVSIDRASEFKRWLDR